MEKELLAHNWGEEYLSKKEARFVFEVLLKQRKFFDEVSATKNGWG
jgi:hypothetical protein